MTGTWATGWVDGDAPPFTELRKGVGSIFDTTLGVSAGVVDITSIPAGYAHLLVWIYARSDGAAGSPVSINARFNHDTTNNYDFQELLGEANVASASEAFGAAAVNIGLMPSYFDPVQNLFNANVLFIPHYAGTANNKAFIALSASKRGTFTTAMDVAVFGGSWRSNAAINQITITNTGTTFAVGTRVTVYAMGA